MPQKPIDFQAEGSIDFQPIDFKPEGPITQPPQSWSNRLGLDPASMMRMPVDFAEGAVSGAASTMYHSADVLNRLFGLERKILTPEAQQAMTAPPSLSGKIGKVGEQIAEFVVPGTLVSKGATAITSGMGKAAQLFGQAMAGGLSSGAVAGLQTGDLGEAKKAAVTGAAMPVVGAAVAPLAKAGVKSITDLWGKSTGVGGEALRTAATTASSKFKEALRGKVDAVEIVDDLKSAVKDLTVKRANEYQAALSQIDQTVKVPIADTLKEIQTQLPNFRIRLTPNGLNFKTSTLVGKDAEIVETAVRDAFRWKDLSPSGMDALKQRLYQYADEAGPQAGAFINRIAGKVRDSLNSNVQGYREMTKDYENASKFLKSVTKEFSTSSENPGVTVRKLANALNQNNDYRKALLEAIDSHGHEIIPQIAGSAMSSFAPRGLAGVGLGVGGSLSGALSHDPVQAMAGIAATSPIWSPRIAGEMLALLSTLRRAVPGPPMMSPAVTGAVTTGLRQPPNQSQTSSR